MINHMKGDLFILSAPSGAGKTSLVKVLLKKNNNLIISTSHTTRQPRENEIDGKDYYFVKEAKFKDLIKKDYFIEYAKVFGNYYGTSRSLVQSQLEAGGNIILEIDWQGAQKIRTTGLNVTSIFILPPDIKTLRERLLNRKKDGIKIIEQRMCFALEEILHYKEFEFVIINDDFEETLIKLNDIIANPKTDLHRQSSFFDNFVKQMMAEKD
ncbi:MAG: guanylate kinase [Pseudomonadota bacterium]|nr:guanylate kinase [Pseudomonadota bacterium]